MSGDGKLGFHRRERQSGASYRSVYWRDLDKISGTMGVIDAYLEILSLSKEGAGLAFWASRADWQFTSDDEWDRYSSVDFRPAAYECEANLKVGRLGDCGK